MAVDQPTVNAVTEQASDVAATAAQSGRQVGNEAATQASEVVRQSKEQMRTLFDDTKQEIHTQAQQRGEQAAKALHSFSDQLASLAEGRPEEAGQLSNYVREAEGRVRDFAGRLEARGPDGVVADLSDFARRRPGTFLLGAACAGFLIGRIVRAGSSHDGGPSQPSYRGTSQPSYGGSQPYSDALPAPEPSLAPPLATAEALPTGGGG
jgi:hypothetical protein